jgi:hypothetical protein
VKGVVEAPTQTANLIMSLHHRNKNSSLVSLSLSTLFAVLGVGTVAAQSLAPTPSASVAPPTTVTPTTETRANGVITTFTSGLPTTVTFLGTATATASPIPVGNAVTYINKNGIQIDPAMIKPGTPMQAIVDSEAGSPIVRQIMVDQQ